MVVPDHSTRIIRICFEAGLFDDPEFKGIQLEPGFERIQDFPIETGPDFSMTAFQVYSDPQNAVPWCANFGNCKDPVRGMGHADF